MPVPSAELAVGDTLKDALGVPSTLGVGGSEDVPHWVGEAVEKEDRDWGFAQGAHASSRASHKGRRFMKDRA